MINRESKAVGLATDKIAKAVVGDRAEAVQLLPDNGGPHDYQANLTIMRCNADQLEATSEDAN